MKFKKIEKNWILYDVGNSAYILLATTIMPIVFDQYAKGSLSSTTYLAYWGYATTIATLIVAVLGPILGTASDGKNRRKLLFIIFAFLGMITTAIMPIYVGWFSFLLLYVISKVGFNGSIIFYDSMLNDITEKERMDRISSHGFAWGYIGSCVPFILAIGLIFSAEKIGLTSHTAMIVSFILTALWWLVFTLPLIKNYKQVHYAAEEQSIKSVFIRLYHSLGEMKRQPKIFLFLVAFFFYIDGVYTMINMAIAYGKSLGLSSNGLILALLVTQIVAFPCALFFSRLSKKIATHKLLKIGIIAYLLISFYAIQLDRLVEFWALAIAVGMFQGAVQALSRSYFAKIIPDNKSGEYFGIYDICGKGATILGTLLISVITQMTGNQHLAIVSLSVMFIIGLVIFYRAVKVAE